MLNLCPRSGGRRKQTKGLSFPNTKKRVLSRPRAACPDRTTASMPSGVFLDDAACGRQEV
jgi:hypothetical protein